MEYSRNTRRVEGSGEVCADRILLKYAVKNKVEKYGLKSSERIQSSVADLRGRNNETRRDMSSETFIY
jgi:hypothetical protein